MRGSRFGRARVLVGESALRLGVRGIDRGEGRGQVGIGVDDAERPFEICLVPLRAVVAPRIGTFGLAVGAAWAFSLGIAGQVLTFLTRAWLSFAPSTCRMSLGQYQDIHRTDPEGRVNPRF